MNERGNRAEINLSAIAHNFRVIRSKLKKDTRLCAVVKADAYGHGALAVAKKAVENGADYLAVAAVSEGIKLREAGFTEPILILGLAPSVCAEDIVAANLTATVCDALAAEAVSRAAVNQNKVAKVHLKIETGMGRIGIPPQEAGETAKKIAALPNVELEGMFSHFAAADDPDRGFTRRQIELFRRATESVERENIFVPIKHIAESAAILSIPEAHFDMVRAGIIEYGLYPSPDMPKDAGLIPAMKFCADVVLVKEIEPGETIGYGHEFVAQRKSRIATLAVGYADGYIRAYAPKGEVEIRGKRAKIVGRICMDQTMVDVTDIEGVQAGDTAVLFGSQTLTADDAARFIGSINYEVTCLVSARVPRVYLEA